MDRVEIDRIEWERMQQKSDIYWQFLACLQGYVSSVQKLNLEDTDLGRTRLLSTLAEYMRPVLRADLAVVGYRELEGDLSDCVYLDSDTIKPERADGHKDTPLIKGLEESGWAISYSESGLSTLDYPATLFDSTLEKSPWIFRTTVTALAVSRVTLGEREYYLFFCDVEGEDKHGPRYDSFDNTMLAVATGVLQTGFQSGARGGGGDETELKQAFGRVLIFLLGVTGISLIVPMIAVLAPSISPLFLFLILLVAIISVFGAMHLLSDEQTERLLARILDIVDRLIPGFRVRDDDKNKPDEGSEPDSGKQE